MPPSFLLWRIVIENFQHMKTSIILRPPTILRHDFSSESATHESEYTDKLFEIYIAHSQTTGTFVMRGFVASWQVIYRPRYY